MKLSKGLDILLWTGLKACTLVGMVCKRLGTVGMLVSIDLAGGHPQGSEKGPGPVLPLASSRLDVQANHLSWPGLLT